MIIRQVLTTYFRNFGFRGVLAIAAYGIFHRPKMLLVRHPGIPYPFRVRLRTSDVWVYEQILVEEEYSFDLAFTPKIIIDAGANIGLSSIYFALKYPNARIIALEPEPTNFELLAQNVQPYPAITPVRVALWNKEGEVSIGDPEGTASVKSGFVVQEKSGTKVRAVTMETLMRELDIPAIDLAKIDIEGAELELFESTQWLAGLGCMMIELHDRFRPGCGARVESALHGFHRSDRGETTFYVRKDR